MVGIGPLRKRRVVSGPSTGRVPSGIIVAPAGGVGKSTILRAVIPTITPGTAARGGRRAVQDGAGRLAVLLPEPGHRQGGDRAPRAGGGPAGGVRRRRLPRRRGGPAGRAGPSLRPRRPGAGAGPGGAGLPPLRAL